MNQLDERIRVCSNRQIFCAARWKAAFCSVRSLPSCFYNPGGQCFSARNNDSARKDFSQRRSNYYRNFVLAYINLNKMFVIIQIQISDELNAVKL